MLCVYLLVQDADVLYAWLASMRLDHLCELFLQAGYDMPTISRMTPEVRCRFYPFVQTFFIQCHWLLFRKKHIKLFSAAEFNQLSASQFELGFTVLITVTPPHISTPVNCSLR